MLVKDFSSKDFLILFKLGDNYRVFTTFSRFKTQAKNFFKFLHLFNNLEPPSD